MLDDSASPPILPSGHDPALLAFIKCHVTSLDKWDCLRVLCEQVGRWVDAADIRDQHGRIGTEIGQALAELASEGVVECQIGSFGEALYRLHPDDPTTTVVCRLVSAVSHSHDLRQILVANLMHTAASS